MNTIGGEHAWRLVAARVNVGRVVARVNVGLIWLCVGAGAVGCGAPPAENPPPPRCGDSVANSSAEECDGDDLRGVRCLDLGYPGGLLQCSPSCLLEDSQCSRPCGDGVADPGQVCDGADLGGQTCEGLGHYRGTLLCTSGCQLDDSSCERCGDGQAQPGDAEECDGDDLDGESCLGLGYYGGALVCGETCQLDPADCVAQGRCGDGDVQTAYGEECEGVDLGPGGETCYESGSFTGEPQCTDCTVDVSVCERVTQVGTGMNHTCAVTDLGRAFCWGSDSDGQLGNGGLAASSTPSLVVAPGVVFTKVAGGMSHTCGLTSAGHVFCWGEGDVGQIGDGILGNSDVPITVTRPAGVTFTAMDVGGSFACALDQTGAAWCWGSGYNGCQGDGTWDESHEPTPVSMPAGVSFTDISCGRVHACAIDQQGAAWCGGSNNDGELGYGYTGTSWLSPAAVQMPAARTFTTISAGQRFTCALDDLSHAWCWGGAHLAHIACALGDGVCDGSAEPVAVQMSTAGTFTAIGTAYNFVCAVSGQGRLWCWGVGAEGQLGHPCANCHCEAFRADGSQIFTTVAATDYHGCAVDVNGLVWCWGAGDNGRLGAGNTQDAESPQAVSEP